MTLDVININTHIIFEGGFREGRKEFGHTDEKSMYESIKEWLKED
jgi:hypothetical protein